MTIEQQLERLLGAVNTLVDASERNTQDITRLAGIAELHQQSLEQHQRNFDSVITELQRQGAEMREMQAEIRGLQTENRRILDQLINRDGENP